MVKSLDKIDGMRIEALGDRELEVQCSCKKLARVPSRRLLRLLDPTTKIKAVIPLLNCVECGKRDVQSYRIVE